MTNTELERAIRIAWARLMAMLLRPPVPAFNPTFETRKLEERRDANFDAVFKAMLRNYENLLAEQSARAEYPSFPERI